MSVFVSRGLTQERPGEVADRVYNTLLQDGDTDLLNFFRDAGKNPGGNIRLLQRPDPPWDKDPLPALLVWTITDDPTIGINEGIFFMGVGLRAMYREPDRYRDATEPDVSDLIWKIWRPLWNRQNLTDPVPGPTLDMDAKATVIRSFVPVNFFQIEDGNNPCVEVVEVQVIYEVHIDKVDI